MRPLASWEPFVLRLDKEVLVTFLRRMAAAKAPQLEDLALSGRGDRLKLNLVLRLGGIRLHAALEVEELRLKAGFFGSRLVSLRGPLGIGVPSVLLGMLFRRLPVEASWDPQDRVLVLDLRRLLPAGVDVTVEDVRLTDGFLEVHLGSGTLAPPLPGAEPLEEEPPPGV